MWWIANAARTGVCALTAGTLSAQCLVNAKIATSGVCAGFPTTAVLYSSGALASCYTDFGDGYATDSCGAEVSHVYALPGQYTVLHVVTDTNGCADSTKAIINIKESPRAYFQSSDPAPALGAYRVLFRNGSSGAYYYEWTFGDGTSDSGAIDPVHYYADTGSYVVVLRVTNQYGCTSTLQDTIWVLPTYELRVPDAFTPGKNFESDGSYSKRSYDNDVFFPVAEHVRDFYMTIYNRWGQVIFESFDVNVGWNGYYRGKLCPQDMYVYHIFLKFDNGQEITKVGDVILVR